MYRLIWKEWHEQRANLAFGCLVLGTLALVGLRTRIIADETMILWVCFIGVTVLPVLACCGLIPAERAGETFESLLSLPVSPWRILGVKTAMGLVLVAAPLATAAVASLWVAGGREMEAGAMAALYVRSGLTALALFIWMHTLTIYLPTEARAGLLSMGLLIFWLMATAGLNDSAAPPLLIAVSPLAFVDEMRVANKAIPSPAAMLVIQTFILAALWLWAGRRITAAVKEIA